MPDSTSQGITFPLPGDLVRNPSMAAQLATDMETLARTADDAIRSAAWPKLPLTETGNLDTLPSGAYPITSTQVIAALGTPDSVPGTVEVFVYGTVNALQRFTEFGDRPRMWIRRRTSGGWSPWVRARSAWNRGLLTEADSLDTLLDGAASVATAQAIEALKTPDGKPGTVEAFEYSPTNVLQRFTEFGASPSIWTRRKTSAGWLPWEKTTQFLLQVDTSDTRVPLIDQDHYSATAYAINVQNFPGASTPVCIHQYSSKTAAFVLDNCGSGAALHVNNTRNTSITPDSNGTGPFLKFGPWDGSAPFPAGNYTKWLTLEDDLTWRNDTDKVMSFQRLKAGPILTVKDTAGADMIQVEQSGDVKWVKESTGPVLTAPDGTEYRITATDAGGLALVGPSGDARLTVLEYDSGPRNVSSLLANGWTGTAYIQRTGSDVQLRLEGVTAPSTGSTSPYVFGPGFMPRGAGFASRGLLFTTATNPVVRRFDVAATTGQLTIRNHVAGEVLYGEVLLKTTQAAPTTLPGTPA